MVSKAVLSTVMTLKANASIIKFDKPPRNAKYWFPILDDTTFENKKMNAQLYCSIVQYLRNAMCNQYQR